MLWSLNIEIDFLLLQFNWWPEDIIQVTPSAQTVLCKFKSRKCIHTISNVPCVNVQILAWLFVIYFWWWAFLATTYLFVCVCCSCIIIVMSSDSIVHCNVTQKGMHVRCYVRFHMLEFLRANTVWFNWVEIMHSFHGCCRKLKAVYNYDLLLHSYLAMQHKTVYNNANINVDLSFQVMRM